MRTQPKTDAEDIAMAMAKKDSLIGVKCKGKVERAEDRGLKSKKLKKDIGLKSRAKSSSLPDHIDIDIAASMNGMIEPEYFQSLVLHFIGTAISSICNAPGITSASIIGTRVLLSCAGFPIEFNQDLELCRTKEDNELLSKPVSPKAKAPAARTACPSPAACEDQEEEDDDEVVPSSSANLLVDSLIQKFPCSLSDALEILNEDPIKRSAVAFKKTIAALESNGVTLTNVPSVTTNGSATFLFTKGKMNLVFVITYDPRTFALLIDLSTALTLKHPGVRVGDSVQAVDYVVPFSAASVISAMEWDNKPSGRDSDFSLGRLKILDYEIIIRSPNPIHSRLYINNTRVIPSLFNIAVEELVILNHTKRIDKLVSELSYSMDGEAPFQYEMSEILVRIWDSIISDIQKTQIAQRKSYGVQEV